MTGIDRRDFVKVAGATGAGLTLPGSAAALETVSDDLDADGGLQEAIVVFRENDDTALLDGFDLERGRYDYDRLPMSWTFLTGDQIETLAGDDRVLHVSDVFELEYYNDPESREAMHVEAAYESEYRGEDVDVVVIDSGLDGSHPDFQGRVESNHQYLDEPFGDRDPEMWVDVGGGDTDEIGHGTHCAGIMAGDGAASEMDPSIEGSYRGMAPEARISSYNVSQAVYLPYAVGAWDDVIGRKQDDDSFDPVVCTNSYGVARGSRYNPLDPLNLATWKGFEAGILPVFAFGNDGPDEGTANRYAKAPHVLGVAAGTKKKGVTDFSSRGRNVGSDLPDGSAVTDTYHDRATLLANVEGYHDVREDGFRIELDAGTLSGELGPGVRAPYGAVDEGGQQDPYKLSFGDRADELQGTLSLTPDGQQVEVSFYEADEDNPENPTSGELLARMGEEPVYIHKDIGLDLPDSDVWVVFETQNAVGVQYEFEYAIYENLDRTDGGYETDDLSQYRPLTLYRPGVLTHGNLVMSTVDPHDALAPTDTSTDGGRQPFYARFSGTSMACPAAAGIAALVIEAGRDDGAEFVGYGEEADSDSFDPADVIATVEAEAAIDASEPEQVDYTPANAGPGYVDADSAVERAADGDFAAFSEADLADPGLATRLSVSGSRSDDGSAFTGGQTNHVELTPQDVETVTEDTESAYGGEVTVYDRIPSDWSVVAGASEDEERTEEAPSGTTVVEVADATAGETVDYFVEAPSDPSQSDGYSFGPAFAVASKTGIDYELQAEFGGEDANNLVLGQSQP